MALDPLEWGVIAVMAIVLFLYGPQKIPELARALGRAKREFDTASNEFRKAASTLESPSSILFSPTNNSTSSNNTSATTTVPPPPQSQALPQPKTGDEMLIETARRLGIQTQGKTREQVQEEIIKMARKDTSGSGAGSSSSAPPQTP